MLKKFRFTSKKKDKTVANQLIGKTNSEKLDVIISEIVSIKKDIIGIKENVKDFREEFNKYKKQDSDFQENRNNNFIISLLEYNRNTYFTELIPIKNIYTPYSKYALSEIDGLILYTPNQNKMPKISDELLDRADKVFQASLKENLSKINTYFSDSYLIIVESKRSISKQKVDTKLRQFYEFAHILQTLNSIDMNKVVSEFKNMITYLESSSLDLNAISLLFMFSSDDITPDIRRYIIAIENGITKEEYGILCRNMYASDIYAKHHLTTLISSDNISQSIKSELKLNKTYEELTHILQPYLKEYDMGYLKDFFTPYEELEHIFKFMKGKIGVSQFNKAIFPKLLHFEE